MVKKIRRKVKKIAMKASLVSMDLEDITEENKQQKQTLAEDFSQEFEFLEWRKQQEQAKSEEALKESPVLTEDCPSSVAHNAPDEIKKLYRAVAQVTHPDKVRDEQLNGIFRRAAEAMENENWMLLVELAGELRLDISFLSDEACDIIEKSIERNESQIANIKNSFSYIWSCQKSDKDRDIFKSLFYQQFKIDADAFNEWLMEKNRSS